MKDDKTFSSPHSPLIQEPPVGQGLLIFEDSQSHSDTPHSVGLFWTSYQRDAKTALSDDIQHSRETDVHTPAGFEPAVLVSERLQTDVLERAATGIGG